MISEIAISPLFELTELCDEGYITDTAFDPADLDKHVFKQCIILLLFAVAACYSCYLNIVNTVRTYTIQ